MAARSATHQPSNNHRTRVSLTQNDLEVLIMSETLGQLLNGPMFTIINTTSPNRITTSTIPKFAKPVRLHHQIKPSPRSSSRRASHRSSATGVYWPYQRFQFGHTTPRTRPCTPLPTSTSAHLILAQLISPYNQHQAGTSPKPAKHQVTTHGRVSGTHRAPQPMTPHPVALVLP